MTVTVADDGFYTDYGDVPVCESPNPEQPTGIITYPVSDYDVESGEIDLTANYSDPTPDGQDPVNWAVREGTCDAGVNTVWGNVDGHDDPFTWDGSSFSSPFDTTQFTPGDYCFVFNPTDDPGENNVRETRWFTIESQDEPNPEPTYACSDDVDNDQDGLIDANDPGCHSDGNADNSESYVPTDDDEFNEPEIVEVFACSDGIDNDHDGLIDADDPGCHENDDINAAYNSSDNDEGNRVGSRSGGFASTGSTGGSVLGAEVSCGIYLNNFLRIGWPNNPSEVKKLQTFLNKYNRANLPVTGFFGPLTYQAVKNFQVKYWHQILAPWVPHGLASAKTPTGYVYKTTRRWINMISCPELGIVVPQLP